MASLHDLVIAYYKVGEYQKALELNERAYALHCEVFGDRHPNTLKSLNNLAYSYYNVGEYQKALEILVKVYQLSCEVLGKNHPDTLNALRLWGALYNRIAKQ